jgi:hypothetical protein
VDAAVEEGAGGQHHRAGAKAKAHLGDGTDDAVALHHQVVHRLLEQPQVGLVLQPAPDGRLVQHPVGLRPGGAHRRPLAGIEDAELDAGLVGGQRHRAAECIHLLDQMPLADAADRGLQLICPASRCCGVSSSVAQPMRAAASAASVPAWPPPTTMTSNSWGCSTDGPRENASATPPRGRLRGAGAASGGGAPGHGMHKF